MTRGDPVKKALEILEEMRAAYQGRFYALWTAGKTDEAEQVRGQWTVLAEAKDRVRKAVAV